MTGLVILLLIVLLYVVIGCLILLAVFSDGKGGLTKRYAVAFVLTWSIMLCIGAKNRQGLARKLGL